MRQPITEFKGPYRWLSNFFPSPMYVFDVVLGENITVPTVEHGFQMSKTEHKGSRSVILTAGSPAEAKRLGRACTLRPDWEDIKLDEMRHWLQLKFGNPIFQNLLLDTSDAELVEGNTWGDRYWGMCRGVGENHLGKLLMGIRAELRGK